jgi:hypothetical protein
MSDFDPLKAIREQIVGLIEVDGAIRRQEREAEEAIGKAEQQLNNVRKLRGFLRIQIDELRARVQKLERDMQQ